jgi:hypothetical protein
MEIVLQYIGNSKAITCGDFDIDLIKNNPSNDTNNFVNVKNEAWYLALNNNPTRITLNSATLIDHI